MAGEDAGGGERLLRRVRRACGGRPGAAPPGPRARLAWHQTLEQFGLHTDFAEDGEEALEKLVAEDYAGALLSDSLSIIDGFEVASALKNHLQGRPCPPLLLIAEAPSITLEQRSRDAGIDAVIHQDQDQRSVENTLREWIEITR